MTLHSAQHSPRHIRHLDFISQSDALSRIEVNTFTSHSGVDLEEMARAQATDPDLTTIKSSPSLKLENVPLPALITKISAELRPELCRYLYDISTGVPRRFVPHSFRRSVDTLHSLSHPGVKATTHLVTTRYLWPRMKADVHT